jgi:glutaredoxin-like protein
MAVINDSTKETVKKKLEEGLESKITLVMFTQEFECQFCSESRELVNEVAQLSPKIEAKVYDFMKDEKQAKKYGVKKIPAIVMLGDKDYGVRFYGTPSGYEFPTFVEDMINVSKGKTDLSEDVKKELADIKKKVHIQVLVTPTCPYCSKAVLTAHKIAIENDNITADMVEIVEFPDIAQRYSAMSVPKIVINELADFTGAEPPEKFLEEIHKALSAADNPMYM